MAKDKSTRYARFTGECRWVKTKQPDPMYGYYGLEMKLDDKQINDYKKIGFPGKIKEDNWVAFKRKATITTTAGKVILFGPPKVKDDTGADFDGYVGNGSECTADIALYDTIKGLGHRLDTVWINKLIEFTPTQRFVNISDVPDSSANVTAKIPF